MVRDACKDLIGEMVALPWALSADKRTDGSQKEHPAFSNHATDAMLYGWRDCTAFMQQPLRPTHAYGSQEFEAEEEEAVERKCREDASLEWWQRVAE